MRQDWTDKSYNFLNFRFSISILLSKSISINSAFFPLERPCDFLASVAMVSIEAPALSGAVIAHPSATAVSASLIAEAAYRVIHRGTLPQATVWAPVSDVTEATP